MQPRILAGLAFAAGHGLLAACHETGARAHAPMSSCAAWASAAGVLCLGLRPDRQRYFDLHHSDNDSLAALHPRELALGAAAMARVLYVVAELDDPIVRGVR